MMVGYKWLFLLIIKLSLFSSIVQANDKLYNYDYLKPYLFSFGVDEDRYGKIVNGQYLDPLGVSTTAISFFYFGHATGDQELTRKGLDIVKTLESYPHIIKGEDSIVYTYDKPTYKFKAYEWWSAMSNTSISLAYLMAYNETSLEQYKDTALKALKGVTNPVSKNGSALVFSDNSKWFKEYVDKNVTTENAMYVLNGFTYSLVGIKIIADYLEDNEVLTEFNLGLKGFERKHQEYHDEAGWLFYMLHPHTIESAHYGVFDLLLIKTLNLMTENAYPFLVNEQKTREDIFKKKFGLYKEGNEIYFSAIGNPYPYWVDLYPGKLVVNRNHGQSEIIEIAPLDYSKSTSVRTFVNLGLPASIHKINVTQIKNGVEFDLFSVSPEEIPNVDQRLISYPADFKIYDEVISAGNKVTTLLYTSDENKELRVQLKFDNAIFLSSDLLQLINFKYVGRIKAIQILLIDEDGKAVNSYYPKPSKDFQTIAFNLVGFLGYEKISKRIQELRLYFSFDVGDAAQIEITDILFNVDYKSVNALFKTQELFEKKQIIKIPFKD